jgi:hypothetical protein
MVAAAIFLNGNMAFWTILRVCIQPIRGLTIVAGLFQPSSQDIACDWFVPLLSAVETEYKAALASYLVELDVCHFHSSAALRIRTPFDEFVTLNWSFSIKLGNSPLPCLNKRVQHQFVI